MAAALRELEDKCRVRLEGRTEGMEGLRIVCCLLLFFTFFAFFFFFCQNMRGGDSRKFKGPPRNPPRAGGPKKPLGPHHGCGFWAMRGGFCENLLTSNGDIAHFLVVYGKKCNYS